MNIQFHKANITEEDIAEVVDALRSGWITMGPKTIEFEEKFKEYIENTNAVSCNSATAALHLSLKAIGLKAGAQIRRVGVGDHVHREEPRLSAVGFVIVLAHHRGNKQVAYFVEEVPHECLSL